MTTRNIKEKARKIEQLLQTRQPNWDKRIWKLAHKCFNEILTTNQSLGGGPFFDLNENWALLKDQKFDRVLSNIKDWLDEVDSKYDISIADKDQTIFETSGDGIITIKLKGMPEIIRKIEDKEDVVIEVNMRCG